MFERDGFATTTVKWIVWYYQVVPKSKTPANRPAPAPGTPAKPVTLRDLATHLGLSRSTVSMVLSNSPVAQGLTPETRERVLKAAAELNYKANYFARMLNNKRSHMVGILTPDLGEGYNASILTAIERLLIERNYLYFVSSHYWNKDLIQQRMQVFAERGVEGLILINTPIDAAPSLPTVSIGDLNSQFPITCLTLDNAHGVRLALEYLYSLGHRDIAFLKGHTASSDTEARWEGFVRGMRELGLRIDPEHFVQLERVDEGLNPIGEGYQAAKQLLKAARPFTALIAFNDLSAIGALDAFRSEGKRVPEDVSVVGFDDIQTARIVQPPLTTVRQPLTQMGNRAASEILALIENGEAKGQTIGILPELTIRQSTAVAKTP